MARHGTKGARCPGALRLGRWRAPGRAAVRVAVPATCDAAKRVSASGASTPRQMVHRGIGWCPALGHGGTNQRAGRTRKTSSSARTGICTAPTGQCNRLGAAPAPKLAQPATAEKECNSTAVNGCAQGAEDAKRRHEAQCAERFALAYDRASGDKQEDRKRSSSAMRPRRVANHTRRIKFTHTPIEVANASPTWA